MSPSGVVRRSDASRHQQLAFLYHVLAQRLQERNREDDMTFEPCAILSKQIPERAIDFTEPVVSHFLANGGCAQY